MRCATCDAVLGGDPRAPCPRCSFASALALGGSAAPAPAGENGSLRPAVPGYDPLYELGRGAMGVVWLARDTTLDRLVALKLIAAGADPRLGARLLREGRAIAQLRHPHIVAVHALGEADGATFLAMDFLAGGDLAARLKADPPAPRAAAALARRLADALAHAHAAGVLHRDLKPSNILLDEAGAPRLADFGLAAPLAGSGDLTARGEIAGTPAFLAPELLGGADRAAPASDLYGLGAVLYACLTGRAPFVGESTAAILTQLAGDEPPSPRLLNPAVPSDLETVCLKCLEKNPARRYATAAELRDDLDRFLRDEPVRARPVGRAEMLFRWARRKPALAAVSALALALLVTLAIGGPLAAWRIERARALADEARREAQAATGRTREQLRAALLARSQATRLSGQMGQRRDALAAALEAARIRPGLDVRNEVIAALTLPEFTLAAQWPQPGNATQIIVFDPDRKRYAISDPKGGVALHRFGDGAPLKTFAGRGAAVAVGPVFSPDGDKLALRDHAARVVVWHTGRGEPTFVLEERPYVIRSGNSHYGAPDAFSPDGAILASTTSDGFSLHDATDGRELRRIELEGPVAPSHVAFSPDGSLLAVGLGLRSRANEPIMFLRVFATADGAEIARMPVTDNFQMIAWSPDGTSLLATGMKLEVFSARTGKPERAISDPSLWWGQFGPEGLLMGGDRGGTVTVWDPERVRPLLAVTVGYRGLGLDRSRLQIAGATTAEVSFFQLELPAIVRSIALESTGTIANVTNHGGSAIDYSPDGRWLATAEWGAVRLREAATGRVRSTAILPTGNNHCSVRFARDGQSLLSAGRESGFVRLPILWADDGAPRLGAPEAITAERGFVLADLSPDGRRAALVSMWRAEVRIVALDDGSFPAQWRLPDAGRAVFLDGGSAVLANSTAEMGRTPLAVHDAATGRELRALPHTRGYHVRASADGRWLVLGTGPKTSVLLHADGTPGPALPQDFQGAGKNAAFSPDGGLLAIGAGATVGLVRTTDGAVVAHLTTLRAGSYVPELAFSPDGAQLTLCWENGLLTQWDLVALRRELAARGLDW